MFLFLYLCTNIKNNIMKILELFSGIGGFTKGFQQAGYEFSEHYFSEIDKYAIANYKYNYPNAKHIGSVTDIPNGKFRGIDIITFGSPFAEDIAEELGRSKKDNKHFCPQYTDNEDNLSDLWTNSRIYGNAKI